MVELKEKMDEVAAGYKFNRTGIGTSPFDAKEMIEAAKSVAPSSTVGMNVASFRVDVIRAAEPIGSLPPPSTLKGAGKTTLELLRGKHASVLIDELGARLQFERTGTRLYEAVLAKYDALGSWEGGPTRDELHRFYSEEFEHFLFLGSAMEKLGADPTAVTPAADLTAVESKGILAAIVDPRTTLAESLHALLQAELSDEVGWETLIRVAQRLGQDEIAERAESALIEEQRHLVRVREWWVSHTIQRAEGDVATDDGGIERPSAPT